MKNDSNSVASERRRFSRWWHRVFTTVAVLLNGGCATLVFKSEIPSSPETVGAIPGEYRIEQYSYHCPNSFSVIDPVKYLDKSMGAINEKILMEEASRRRLPMFCRNPDGSEIRVGVEVNRMNDGDRENILLSAGSSCLALFTLFLVPEYRAYSFPMHCRVILYSRWGKELASFDTGLLLKNSMFFGLTGADLWTDVSVDDIVFSRGRHMIQESAVFQPDSAITAKTSNWILNMVMHVLYANRREIKQKILFAELEKRWAVLVGLESDRALFAADDAGTWRKWMAADGWPEERVKAMTGKNVQRNDLEGVFENFLGNATANDLIVLMWSGDVYADPARPDDVYLACRDTDPKTPWTGYRLADLFKALKENRASKVVLLLDVCNGSGKKLLTREYLKKLGPLPDWMLIVNESAKRGDDRSSGVLARLLPEGLDGKADSDGDRLVTLKELAVWLKSGSTDYGDLLVWMPAESSKLPEFPLSNR